MMKYVSGEGIVERDRFIVAHQVRPVIPLGLRRLGAAADVQIDIARAAIGDDLQRLPGTSIL
jgi:hypothetical protein